MNQVAFTNRIKTFNNQFMSKAKQQEVKDLAKTHNARLSQSITERGVKELGQKEFLKLFVEELKYQDPLNPMKDKEFIAQMASFSTLEQMNNMNKTIADMGQIFNKQNAVGLIGKNIEAVQDDVLIKGEVTKISLEKGQQRVWIKNPSGLHAVSPKNITVVRK